MTSTKPANREERVIRLAAKPTFIDDYLASASPVQRAALQKLRRAIRAAAPGAEECISYGLPAFRLRGRMLAAFGAAKRHCSFYPMSSLTVAAHRSDLKGYDTSKGTIRFPPDRPLPAALVRKLIKARIAENDGRPGRRCAPKRVVKPGTGGSQTDPAVAEFWRRLDHPLKKEIETVRRIILGVSPDIREGVKWNSVSFRTTDYFATVNSRARDGVQLVFHKGAKVRDNSTKGMRVADPKGLIRWLAGERCLVTLGAGRDIPAHRAALVGIVRDWIQQM